MSASTAPARPVRRRHVLYVSGFDPQGPARYHRLYREQAQAQAAVSGHRIEVGPRRRLSPQVDAWDIDAEIEGQACRTRYDFLRWDDVVRANWMPGHARYLMATLGATWRFAASGVLWRMFKGSRSGFWVCFGPFAVLLFIVLLAASLGGGAIAAWRSTGLSAWTGLAVLLTAGGGWALSRLSRTAENDWFMGWVMRSYWFTSRQARDDTPDLDARLDAHATYLLDALANQDFDEILLVGHSSGAMMAMIIAARAAGRSRAAMQDPRFGLLTLGQCLPILSFQPQARRFRREIAIAAQALGERWHDFTAPADRCCAALVDPAEAVLGMDGIECPSPKVLSPQFHQLFTPQGYAALRRNLYELHFQYLKAGELPGAYDYFAITAGPQTLVQRFAAQPAVRDWRELQCLGGPFPHLRRARAAG
jgi:pimeloyl-ACP methyl ester carboxylesterase